MRFSPPDEAIDLMEKKSPVVFILSDEKPMPV
jgi:hypothetical protein